MQDCTGKKKQDSELAKGELPVQVRGHAAPPTPYTAVRAVSFIVVYLFIIFICFFNRVCFFCVTISWFVLFSL